MCTCVVRVNLFHGLLHASHCCRTILVFPTLQYTYYYMAYAKKKLPIFSVFQFSSPPLPFLSPPLPSPPLPSLPLPSPPLPSSFPLFNTHSLRQLTSCAPCPVGTETRTLWSAPASGGWAGWPQPAPALASPPSSATSSIPLRTRGRRTS